jgi:hypothetical protein
MLGREGKVMKPVFAGGWNRSQVSAIVSSQLWLSSLYRERG